MASHEDAGREATTLESVGKLVVIGQGSEWFWQILQLVILFITGLFIYRQVRLQRHTHLVDAFATLHAKWQSEHMLRARYKVCRSYAPDVTYIDFDSSQVGMFFEELGVYASRGILDRYVLWEFYSFEIEYYWPILQNRIISFREKRRDKSFFHHFENLHSEMGKFSARIGASTGPKTDALIRDFIETELQAVEGHGGPEPSGPITSISTPRSAVEDG